MSSLMYTCRAYELADGTVVVVVPASNSRRRIIENLPVGPLVAGETRVTPDPEDGLRMRVERLEPEADWYARTMARAETTNPALAGRPFEDLETADLPADRTARHAWRLRGGRVVVDPAVPAPARPARSDAIAAATTLDELKAALLRSGR